MSRHEHPVAYRRPLKQLPKRSATWDQIEHVSRLSVLLHQTSSALAVVLCCSGALQAQNPARVSGTVVTRDGRPITNSLVELSDLPDSARTDVRGVFLFPSGRVGSQTLRMRAIGYAEQTKTILVTTDSGWVGTLVLEPIPRRLPEIEVKSGKPSEYAHTAKYDDFFRRRSMGQGAFRTREDIRRVGASSLASALQSIPGLTVTMTSDIHGAPIVRLRIARCPGNPPNLAIYLNGLQIAYDRSEGGLADAFNSVNLSAIAFIEFYRGTAQIPTDLERGDNCAVLVIWTD